MKTFIHEYHSQKLLEKYIIDSEITQHAGDILIQVFTSISDENAIIVLRKELLTILPYAKIIGTTTSGEISCNGAIKNSTVLSISLFSKTSIKTDLISTSKDSFDNGVKIATQANKYCNLQLLITFTDGLHTNGEEYLNGISSIDKNVIVSGGMAGDYSRFEDTLIFNESKITHNGAVAAALYSKNLHIHTDYSFNWETVGKEHVIEKSVKNRVYQISGMRTIDFYEHYLGKDIIDLLPAIGIEFPLVQKINGVNVARAVLMTHNDGSLSFAGNLEEGSIVQFGHGDVQLIIEKGLETIKKIIKSPIESIFIYSCMARKALLKNDINIELLPLKEIVPIGGFFSYGEFFKKSADETNKSSLLNQTMTILALSENKEKIDKITPTIFDNKLKSKDLTLHRTQALSTLIKRTTKELTDLNQNLHVRVKKEVKLNRGKDNMLNMLHTQAQLGGILEMILHQWRQPISAITSTISSIEVYKEAELLTDEILDKNIQNILSYTEHINTTIEDFRDLFKATNKNKSISIDDLITKTLNIINSIIKKNQITVTKKINTKDMLCIPISLIMQVLLNILKNAIDVLKINQTKNPSIVIEAFQNETHTIIHIIDNGGGIPLEILAKVFDKNFTTKLNHNGTGIGLHMSKQIIETKVNGTLDAKNLDNGLAMFTIKIPFIEE